MIPVNVRRALHLEPTERENRKNRLLIRPARTRHQCRQDHLMQLAEMNALGSLRDLLRCYKASFVSLMVLSEDELHRFLEGGLELRDRSTTSVPYLKAIGLGLPGRICLICNSQGMTVPHYFNYSLSLICPIHETLLLEICDGCESPILYTRKHRLRCGHCHRDFRESQPTPAPDWAKEFRRRFSPVQELGFCDVTGHSDLAITRLLLWHYAPGKNRSKYSYPNLGIKRHPWLEQAAYLPDEWIEKIVVEFRDKYPKHVDDLAAWTRYPTPINSIIQRVLRDSI